MDILTKYTPKTLNEFIGNRCVSQKCKTHFAALKPLLIVGPPGSGKNTFIDLFCRENNVNVLQITKDTISQFDVLAKNETIESFFDKRKKCVFIDNVDTILGTNEKISTSSIVNICKQCIDSKIHLIMTCNSNEEKKANELKKYMEVIRISFPDPKDTFLYVMNIFDSEGIKYESENLLNTCIKYNGCIRETLEQFICGNDVINYTSQFKNINLFDCVKKLLRGDNILHYDIRYLLNDEATMKTFLMFENLPEEIHYNRHPKSFTKSLEAYTNILEKYISSSILESYMYQTHDWWSWDLIHILRILGTYNELKKHIKHDDRENKNQLRLSQLLSKTSHKQILNRRLKSTYEGLSQEGKLILANNIVVNVKSEKQRKLILKNNEYNFINTYDKYFS